MRVQPSARILGAAAVESLDDLMRRRKEAPPLVHFLANRRPDVSGRVAPVVGYCDQLRARIVVVWRRGKIVPGRFQVEICKTIALGREEKKRKETTTSASIDSSPCSYQSPPSMQYRSRKQGTESRDEKRGM